MTILSLTRVRHLAITASSVDLNTVTSRVFHQTLQAVDTLVNRPERDQSGRRTGRDWPVPQESTITRPGRLPVTFGEACLTDLIQWLLDLLNARNSGF